MQLPDPARSRAVLVGAATYADPELPDLPSVANNVHDLAAVLTDPELGGLSASSCRAFVDITVDGLHEALDVAREAEDVLVFYFAGHGLLSDSGKLVLGMANTRAARPTLGGLQAEDLVSAIQGCPARYRVLIFDCCYSERAMRHMGGPEQQLRISGGYLIASAAENRLAAAPVGAEHTAFTGELIALLRTGLPGHGALLSLDSVYHGLVDRLTAKGFPEPRAMGRNSAPHLALSRNPLGPAVRATDPAALRRLILDAEGEIDLDDRIDAVDTLVAGARDDPAYLEQISLLAGTDYLPMLLRVRCAAALDSLGEAELAARALATVNGRRTAGAATLDRLRAFTAALADDARWHELVADAWDADGTLADVLTGDPDQLWGLLMAMLLTEISVPWGRQLDAARDLAALGRPVQAAAILRGLLRSNRLTRFAREQVGQELAVMED